MQAHQVQAFWVQPGDQLDWISDDIKLVVRHARSDDKGQRVLFGHLLPSHVEAVSVHDRDELLTVYREDRR